MFHDKTPDALNASDFKFAHGPCTNDTLPAFIATLDACLQARVMCSSVMASSRERRKWVRAWTMLQQAYPDTFDSAASMCDSVHAYYTFAPRCLAHWEAYINFPFPAAVACDVHAARAYHAQERLFRHLLLALALEDPAQMAVLCAQDPARVVYSRREAYGSVACRMTQFKLETRAMAAVAARGVYDHHPARVNWAAAGTTWRSVMPRLQKLTHALSHAIKHHQTAAETHRYKTCTCAHAYFRCRIHQGIGLQRLRCSR